MVHRASANLQEAADLLVEFCVVGIAISAQSRNRQRLKAWQSKVAAQASVALGGAAIIEGAIEVRLKEFSETRSRDRDNVAKPIQDAMQNVLFSDDRQEASLLSERCDINGRYKVRFMSEVIAAALVAGEEFIWIRIYRHQLRETLTP